MVDDAKSLADWLQEYVITEVECFIPDMTGIARGKIMPTRTFSTQGGLRLPESVLIQTVTGDYADDDTLIHPTDGDMVLRPDPTTVRLVPWAIDPTAQVIHDCYFADGSPVEIAPRHVLHRVLTLYKERGWRPVLAPELEFYLVKTNTDPDYPLEPPIGRSGRAETARQSYSIDAVNEFDPLIEELYDYCEAQRLAIDTLIHEAGAGQMEINLLHGNPLELADQTFLFKRTVRETALRHKMYATFMAKPMVQQTGSAMHIHQSVLDDKTGTNLFANPDGSHSRLFLSYIAGLQKYLPVAMSLFAPNVNSYRRIAKDEAAPINGQWGHDNRTAGFRVPLSGPENRRIENRVPGADANPYLAFAASLACGYLGMVEDLEPSPSLEDNAYELPYGLPRDLHTALNHLTASPAFTRVLGEKFLTAYKSVKEREYDTFFSVISSWEREHLLLNV